MQVIASGIVRVHNQVYIKFINQVFKLFFQKTYDDGNIANACFMELPYQPFDQQFPFHLKKRLGNLPVDRHHAHAKACSKNDGILRRMFCLNSSCFFGTPQLVIYQAFCTQIRDRTVDDS